MKDYWYPKKRLHVFVQMKHQYAIHSLPQRVSAMNTGVFVVSLLVIELNRRLNQLFIFLSSVNQPIPVFLRPLR